MTLPRCAIIPPYLLRRLVSDDDPAVAARAARTLRQDAELRTGRRTAPDVATTSESAEAPTSRRSIHDARNTTNLPGRLVRGEADEPVADASVNEAFDGFGDTWSLLWEVFGRDSIDGAGGALLGTVHYGRQYDNAFWDGDQMVFGDGDEEIFGRFTASVEVIGHELAHGVTSHTANLVYYGQPGALNEHVSDVIGVLVKQRSLGESAEQADWLIGADLLLPGVAGVALRDMLHPGTAYDDPRLGKDPQPDHLSSYVDTTDDHGGVHINSGIPNRAFAVAATTLGGPAWEGVGRVWFDVLTGQQITQITDFAHFAGLTQAAADNRFGRDSPAAKAVAVGWSAVGVTAAEEPSAAPPSDQSGATDLLLRRSGGFAGLVRERRATLSELPTRDARHWGLLLATASLTRRSLLSSGVPDGFEYRVSSQRRGVDVTVAEANLTEPQRGLFERTLRPDPEAPSDHQ